MHQPVSPANLPLNAPVGPGMEAPLLEVRDLRTSFHLAQGVARAVDGVSFQVGRGRTLGIVGESGCGKSVSALSILRLLPMPPARIESGSIRFEGRNLLELDEEEMRKVRGGRIGMIFQEPMTSLNPVYPVGSQVAEVYRLHEGLGRAEAWRRAIEMLDRVRIPSASERAGDYPHQMSGGMRQRVMIAMALACRPGLLIADEPTTALDVTVQAQILALIDTLQQTTGTAVLLITHDLGVVAEIAQEVVVMYAGRIVESGSTETVFQRPLHPYTQGLMLSRPRLDAEREPVRLVPIEGSVPSPLSWPTGCRFHPRCPHARPACAETAPGLEELTPGHAARCLFAREIAESHPFTNPFTDS